MEAIARLAALFMLTLASFHTYGILLILSNIDKRVSIPMFGIYRGYDVPTYSEVMAKTTAIIMSLMLVYFLRWVIEGLWRVQPWAWWSAIGVCLLLITGAVQRLSSNSQAQVEGRYFINYCTLIVLTLIVSAPAFFKRAEKSRPVPARW